MRPNGHELFVNPDLIETAERDQDAQLTTVVLTTGNTLVVTDETANIADKIAAFRRRCAAPA